MTDFTTALDQDSSAGDYIGQSTTPNDNYVLIKVPSHGTSSFYYENVTDTTNVTTTIASPTSRAMTSYLRIGAVPDDDPTLETDGWDLAQLVVAFMDDTRTRPADVDASGTALTGSNTVSNLLTGVSTDIKTAMTTFYGASTVTADQANRITESAKLHYRGGWRDHSDGNRISTTRGDKVEVIRGNYKMMVLGRRPDATSTITEDCLNTPADSLSNAVTTWDASGGHIHDWRFTPGAVTEVSWRKNTDSEMTWRVYEETVKGDVDSTYYGEINDVYFGRRVTEIVGYDKSDTANVPAFVTANGLATLDLPIVTEKTWAKTITDYDGSSGCRVESIDEQTFAATMTSKVDVSGTLTETKNADTFNETIDVGGEMSTTVKAQGLTESTEVDAINRTTRGKDQLGTAIGEFWFGNFGEMFMGSMETLKVGAFLDVRVGVRLLEINVSLPFARSAITAALQIVNVDAAVEKLDLFKGLTKIEVNLCPERVTINTGQEIEASLNWKRVGVAMFLG